MLVAEQTHFAELLPFALLWPEHVFAAGEVQVYQLPAALSVLLVKQALAADQVQPVACWFAKRLDHVEGLWSWLNRTWVCER